MDTDLDDTVNDILTQLKGNVPVAKKQSEEETLTKDQLEEFIIKNSGRLITKSLNIVDDVKDFVVAGSDSKDVAALAELINATSAAIDTLNRVYISDGNNKNRIQVKQMDIESRERINITDNQTKILLSREDIMKALINDSTPIVDI